MQIKLADNCSIQKSTVRKHPVFSRITHGIKNTIEFIINKTVKKISSYFVVKTNIVI